MAARGSCTPLALEHLGLEPPSNPLRAESVAGHDGVEGGGTGRRAWRTVRAGKRETPWEVMVYLPSGRRGRPVALPLVTRVEGVPSLPPLRRRAMDEPSQSDARHLDLLILKRSPGGPHGYAVAEWLGMPRHPAGGRCTLPPPSPSRASGLIEAEWAFRHQSYANSTPEPQGRRGCRRGLLRAPLVEAAGRALRALRRSRRHRWRVSPAVPAEGVQARRARGLRRARLTSPC